MATHQVDQKMRILEMLDTRTAMMKANVTEESATGENSGPILSNLQHVFPVNERMNLALEANRDTVDLDDFAELRDLTSQFVMHGSDIVKKVPAELLNKLGRQNYTPDATEDGQRTRMSILKKVQKQTANDYARRLALLLSFCFTLVEEETAQNDCGLAIKAPVLAAIRRFHGKFQEGVVVDDLISLLLAISSQTYNHLDDYNTDVLCSFAIGLMYDADTGKFKTKESASKTLSAFKYSLRIAILCKLRESTNASDALIQSIQWNRLGTKNTFKQLTILHAGVNSLPRKLKAAAMVIDDDCERASYNGIVCSFDLLNDVVHSLVEKTEEMLSEDLLMGFVPDANNDAGNCGDSSAPFTPHFAFGQVADFELGDMSLFNHIMADEERREQFYGTETQRRKMPKKKEARAFLKDCREYEESLLVLVHILGGCGVRATDYEHLTFMNGSVESEARTVSIYDKSYLHCTIYNKKCTELQGKSKAYSILLPREIADKVFLPYWKYVRPFASLLKLSLVSKKDLQEGTRNATLERWRRYCFVSRDEKWVRKVVCDAFGGPTTGRNFQWLRHSSNFLMKMFVKSASSTPILPVYKLYGHSASTDDCYAVEKLAGFPSEACTNTTDIRLILETFWRKLDLAERRKEPTDVVDVDSDSDDEDSDSDSDSDVASTMVNSDSETEDDAAVSVNEAGESTEEADPMEDDAAVAVNEADESTEEAGPMEGAQEMRVASVVEENVCGDHDNSEETEVVLEVPVMNKQQVDDVDKSDRNSIRTEDVVETAIEKIDGNVIGESWNEEDMMRSGIQKLGLTRFKSQGQKELIRDVMFSDNSVLGVLPTGGGKSLAIFSCLHSSERKLTIVIFPLIAVLSDIKKRLEKMSEKRLIGGHKYVLWGMRKGISAEELLRTGVKLVLVSAEQVQNPNFHAFLHQAKHNVSTVIFDEAPIFTSSAYRKNLALIPVMVRSLTTAKFVLLSATVPVDAESRLLKLFGVPRATKVRMCTMKTNLVHTIERVESGRVRPKDVLRHLLNPDDTVVVFVQSVAQCEELAGHLEKVERIGSSVIYYHAKRDMKERAQAHQAWITGSKRIMIATTAFAFGVDSADCNLVIHVEGAFDLESYCQGAGRAGRNGQQSKSILLVSSRGFRCEDRRLARYMNSRGKCRRLLLNELLDSADLVSKATCGHCDNCHRLGHGSVPLEPRLRTEVNLVQSEESTLVERVAASKRMASARKIGSFLKKCLDSLVLNDQCLTCKLLDTEATDSSLKHGLKQCPHFRNRCFRCGDRHRRSGCEVDRIWKGTCSKNAVCVTCCTPCNSMIKSFHYGELSVGSRCRYRDTIVPACMMLWRERKPQVLGFMESGCKGPSRLSSLTVCQYTRWLCEVTDGLTNAALLISYFVRLNKR